MAPFTDCKWEEGEDQSNLAIKWPSLKAHLCILILVFAVQGGGFRTKGGLAHLALIQPNDGSSLNAISSYVVSQDEQGMMAVSFWR